MSFKLTKYFKECITNIMSNNVKDKIKREGVCSLSFIPSSKLEEYVE
jgi:hypothetical protein